MGNTQLSCFNPLYFHPASAKTQIYMILVDSHSVTVCLLNLNYNLFSHIERLRLKVVQVQAQGIATLNAAALP